MRNKIFHDFEAKEPFLFLRIFSITYDEAIAVWHVKTVFCWEPITVYLFFFNNILRDPSHVLHQLLPHTKHTSYNLRQRSHSLTLPDLHSNLERKNFMYRMLYKDIY